MDTIYCSHCKINQSYTTKERIFENGVKHIEAYCNHCNKWLKFVPQEKELKDIIMPFGKHKGEKIIDIDPDYLYWLLENNVVKGNIKKQIEKIFGGK